MIASGCTQSGFIGVGLEFVGVKGRGWAWSRGRGDWGGRGMARVRVMDHCVHCCLLLGSRYGQSDVAV